MQMMNTSPARQDSLAVPLRGGKPAPVAPVVARPAECSHKAGKPVQGFTGGVVGGKV